MCVKTGSIFENAPSTIGRLVESGSCKRRGEDSSDKELSGQLSCCYSRRIQRGVGIKGVDGQNQRKSLDLRLGVGPKGSRVVVGVVVESRRSEGGDVSEGWGSWEEDPGANCPGENLPLARRPGAWGLGPGGG